MRPLAPRTEQRYAEVLLTAFANKTIVPENLDIQRISTWSESAKNQLRCALTRFYAETKTPKPEVYAVALERKWAVQKLPQIPAETEIEKFENAAKDATPAHRVSASLLLYLGLRAEEFCTLPRAAVLRAVKTGTLTFVRKGGREASLDVAATRSLLVELLSMPSQLRTSGARAWTLAGEVLSASANGKSQYAALRRAVQRIAKLAQIGQLSPHKLRHAFASRLNRDGASVFTVQAALNHKNIATTTRYVHPSAADIAKHMRGPKT